MNRPDLTYLTRQTLSKPSKGAETGKVLFLDNENGELTCYCFSIKGVEKYLTAIQFLPELVQFVETLHDLTEGDPSSLTHQAAKQVLNALALPEWEPGVKVKLIALHNNDAYYGDSEYLAGKIFTCLEEPNLFLSEKGALIPGNENPVFYFSRGYEIEKL